MSQQTGLPESFQDYEHVGCGGRIQAEHDLVLHETYPYCVRCEKAVDRSDIRVVYYDKRND